MAIWFLNQMKCVVLSSSCSDCIDEWGQSYFTTDTIFNEIRKLPHWSHDRVPAAQTGCNKIDLQAGHVENFK